MMIEILYFIPIVLVCFGLGNFLLKSRFRFHSSLEEIVFSIAVGLLSISYLTLLLGLLGLLHRWVFLFVFLLGLVIFSKRISSLVTHMIDSVKKFRISLNTRCFFILILAFMVLLNLIATSVPPWETDTLNYHATVPKIYSINGEIREIPFLIHDNNPLFTEMLYLSGIVLKNGTLSKLFVWFLGVMLIAGIYSLSTRFFSKETGIIAAIIFYTTPMVMQYNTTGMVDLSLSFFIFIGGYAFLVWFNSQNRLWLVLSAIFAGVSGSAKINGAVPMFILIGGIIYRLTIKEKICLASIKKAVQHCLLFGGVMLLIMFPWQLRNYVWTGNPFFPYLCSIFKSRYWSASSARGFYQEIYNWGLGDHSISAFLMLPLYVTFFVNKFGELLGYGPLYLAFIPAALLIKNKKKEANYVLWFSFLSLAIWFLFSQQIRLSMFILPSLALAAGYGVSCLLKTRHRRKYLIIIVLYLLFAGLLWFGVNGKQLKRGLSLESDEEFFKRIKTQHSFEDFRYINENIMGIDRILLYNQVLGYYSEYPIIIARADDLYLEFDSLSGIEELYGHLHELEVSHIFVGKDHSFAYSNKTQEIFRELLDDSLNVYSNEGVSLYKVQYGGKLDHEEG